MAASAALVIAAACAPARADCDVHTEAGLAAAYQKATGKPLPKEHGCIRRSETFPDLVRVGTFAYDRGCIGEGVLAGCRIDPPGYAAAAMQHAGWVKAGPARRRALAVAWLRELDDLRLEDATTLPDGKALGALTARPVGTTLVIEGWVEDPAGMTPETNYRKIRVTFAADGSHGAIATTDQLTERLTPSRP